MKTIQKRSENQNYTSINIGNLNNLGDHIYVLAPGIEIPGKVFVGSIAKCTGTDVSFQITNSGTAECGPLHTHTENEELYIVIKGDGEFQIDESIIPISEGSIIRIAPEAKRTWRNTGDIPMIMITIQSKLDSLSVFGINDANLI